MCIRDSIEINRHRNRLILSERQAVQERRDAMKEKLIEELTEGEVRKGRVSSICDFGAFARIEDGNEGLIHVSELAEERIQHPKQVVEESEELILRIIRIDPQRRRMGLSLRRALDTPDSELVEVFGDEILEERDALARKIRAKLDAEGLTGQVQAPAPEP